MHNKTLPPQSGMKRVQFKVRLQDAGATLGEYLAVQLGLSGRKAKNLLDQRCVFVNGSRIWMARHEMDPGDNVEVLLPDAGERAAADLPVLYRDEYLAVIDKPAGLLTNDGRSAETLLRIQLNCPVLRAVHRLDRDTTGCLLFAMRPEAWTKLAALFAERKIRKQYHAIASGRIIERRRRIGLPIDRQPAVTHIAVVDAGRDATHLTADIETGRTHQIRKHLAAIGHPVLGDRQYATGRELQSRERNIGRQMLHAYRIEFEHPMADRHIVCVAPLPLDFLECLRRYRLA